MMKKLLFLLLLCFLFSSCEETPGAGPYSDSSYTFEVTCDNCTINVSNGSNVFAYHVQGFQIIPFSPVVPVITLSLSTDNDTDLTQVRFTGGGYNNSLYNDYLYYNDSVKIINFNL